MAFLHNRSFVFPVVRHDFTGNDCVVAVCQTPERADELVGEYTQVWLDKGFKEDEYYFYATCTVFYT